NKGRGIEQVQQYFGLKPEECMAFGDNYNDIAMLDKVYYSYVMEKAVEDVKKHGRFVTGWVEGTLREQFKEIR
ncbi:MAG TPA: HAD hydrolase family protein, partial [Lachnospira eligens]|nr:HAD hydrolase family protein [Lachnospira eligens]